MTERYWQFFKKNKENSGNDLFNEVESELKRRFKSEKTPQEMLLLCKTDNNYWKQYRLSDHLDVDSVAMVLCQDNGCEMMYCQALTFSKEASRRDIDTQGCTKQFNDYRSCYLSEKRKFNAKYQEKDWQEDPQLIPNYLKERLKLKKEDKTSLIMNELPVIQQNKNELSQENKQIAMSQSFGESFLKGENFGSDKNSGNGYI